MKNRPESTPSPEQAEKTPQVVLHLFRHAEAERDPNKSNNAFELSETGRKQAFEKGKVDGAKNLKQSVAFGSPRKRAQQTASYIMAGKNFDSITGDETLEELKEKIDQDLKVGSKIGIDPRLDFHLDKNTPFGQEAYKAVFIDKDYLKFLVNRSDALAIETNDKLASTYSRQAGAIAEIIKKYIEVSGQWDKLVKKGEYEDSKLERFLGSHGGVVESFLLKVIEKTKGIGERNRLLSIMPHQFEYTEGINITIENRGQTIHVLFKKESADNPKENFIFDEDISLKIIEEIIEENHA